MGYNRPSDPKQDMSVRDHQLVRDDENGVSDTPEGGRYGYVRLKRNSREPKCRNTSKWNHGI